MYIARKQVLVQFTEPLLAALDQHAAREGRSRSVLIREAIEGYLADSREAEIDRQIVAGYTRIPETEEELRSADAAARDAIREEPW